ncbi:MAG: DEAD/DEAH box helicase, partial [Chloroflexi bacterium]|nr:DEAD/DEAH box helicase [Chloroflexota bacterium]
PLDVLAQQVVAACACEDWEEDALYALCHGAYPYRDLSRERFDQVLAMLSEGVARRDGRRSAWLHRDGVHHRLRGRRGARLAAITSGGAIPDNADYEVVAEPEDTFVGTVNEDFAVESMAGDVFLLGNSSWRIRRVERGRVRVEDAQGAAPTIPFWLGEAPARTPELSEALSAIRDGIDRRLTDTQAAVAWLQDETGAPRDAARQAVDYIAEGKRILGAVPTQERIVAERFFDESGGMQLIVHAPLGGRINRAWGMALRKRFCRTFDFELQAAATDDGINLSLGPQHSFPLEDVFRFLSSASAEEVLVQAVLQAPLFGVRWRWDAARSLALLRSHGGRKVPAPLLRMRADDLLGAVFPAQVACQDNAPPGDIALPDHPLVFETMRDCLTEALDVAGLKGVLAAIERDQIEVLARDTPQPSVFAHQILNCMPYAFLDGAPLEERRARAVTLRRALPEDARELGALDRDAIERESAAAWPVARDADELHDALLALGILPEGDLTRCGDRQRARAWLDDLQSTGRALRLRHPDGTLAWVAAERFASIAPAYPQSSSEPATAPGVSLPTATQEEAVLALVRGRVECSGPLAPQALASSLSLGLPSVQTALGHLEADGVLLRGRFTPACSEEEVCDRRVLARIHRATVAGLRQQIQPVPPATFLRFLLEWQHASPGSSLDGEAGLVAAIEQLQGFEAAASAWEADLLPTRVGHYLPSTLDRLCLSGEVVWGRLAQRGAPAEPATYQSALTRNAPVTLALREDLPWLLDERPAAGAPLAGVARQVLDFLETRGASFAQDVVAGLTLLPSQVDEALWQLVAGGYVTADGFAALRGLISGASKRPPRHSPFRRRPRLPAQAGRWSLLRPLAAAADPVEARARQLLLRYGVVCRELLAREPLAPPWRALLGCYRRLEARGEIRGGRFVAGLVGEQFALPEAVEALRRLRSAPPQGELVALSACDPLNLVGILTPGARVPALPGNRVVMRDGVPVASLAGGEPWFMDSLADGELARARALLAWHGMGAALKETVAAGR